jgi:hypothetical protein
MEEDRANRTTLQNDALQVELKNEKAPTSEKIKELRGDVREGAALTERRRKS